MLRERLIERRGTRSNSCIAFSRCVVSHVAVVIDRLGSMHWNGEQHAGATLALITAANFDRVKDNPETLLSLLRPQHVLLGHWEDFFRSPEKSWRLVRGIDGRALVNRVQAQVGNAWTALEPGAVLRLIC